MASSRPLTILVTGANRGIGYATIQSLALRYPQHTYIIGCRSLSAGTGATTSLRALGITSTLDVLELDVTSNSSILAASSYISATYGHLDVLVNNSGIALAHPPNDLDALRSSYTEIFNTNITSPAALTTALLPLLRLSCESGKVINISSGRASLQNSANGKLPPTKVLAYSVSKVALNALTVEMRRVEEDRWEKEWKMGSGEEREEKGVRFWVVNPGHCRTEFNGWTGKRVPLEGAEVVSRLVGAADGQYGEGGFWECVDGVMRELPW